jgi:glutamate dehydrogenase
MDIKEELVPDVLEKLRQLAKTEAELMFREYNKNPGQALPPYSQLISECIMRVHDATDAALEDMDPETRKSLVLQQLQEHLPRKLKEAGYDGKEETIWDAVPLPYLKQVVCAATASKIVYREGLDYIQALPDESLAPIAFR